MDSLSAFEPGFEHNTLYRMGKWDGKQTFYEIQVLKDGWFFKTEVGFKKRIEDLFDITVQDTNPNLSKPKDFLKRLLPELPFKPYKHQLRLFLGMAESKAHLGVSSVGSGKSLVIYMLIRYFREQNKKILVLVPTIDLTAQLSGDCSEGYLTINKKKEELKGKKMDLKEDVETILIILVEKLKLSTEDTDIEFYENEIDKYETILENLNEL